MNHTILLKLNSSYTDVNIGYQSRFRSFKFDCVHSCIYFFVVFKFRALSGNFINQNHLRYHLPVMLCSYLRVSFLCFYWKMQ